MSKPSDSELIIGVGAFAILIAGILCGFGKLTGGELALVCGSFFGGSAIAAFRGRSEE